MSSSTFNETCISDEVGRWSQGLVIYSYFYSTFCILIILLTSFFWWKLQKKLVYLQKRGFALQLIILLGWTANLIAGPITSTQNSRDSKIHSCIIVNMSFLVTIPVLTLGTCIGVFMFTRRVKLGKLLIKF